jgi:hypothetical protein
MNRYATIGILIVILVVLFLVLSGCNPIPFLTNGMRGSGLGGPQIVNPGPGIAGPQHPNPPQPVPGNTGPQNPNPQNPVPQKPLIPLKPVIPSGSNGKSDAGSPPGANHWSGPAGNTPTPTPAKNCVGFGCIGGVAKDGDQMRYAYSK